MMKNDYVPMSYVLNKMSYDVKKILKYTYLIYGISSFIILYKIIKKDILDNYEKR